MLMIGHGGHHSHYVESYRYVLGTGYRPACRNNVANFEAGVGGEVTCGTCKKLPNIPRRARLLVLTHGQETLGYCGRCQKWRPLSAMGEPVATGARYCCRTGLGSLNR